MSMQYPMMISNAFQACAEHILSRFNLGILETVEEATEAYFSTTTFIIEANELFMDCNVINHNEYAR